MLVEFNHKTQRTVTDKRNISIDEFIKILQTYKPKEIWCNRWSSRTPIYSIHKYYSRQRVVA